MQGRLEPTTLARAFNSLIAGDPVKVVPCSALHTCLTGTWRSGGSGRSHRPRRCCTRIVSKQKGYNSTRRPTPGAEPTFPTRRPLRHVRPATLAWISAVAERSPEAARRNPGRYPPTSAEASACECAECELGLLLLPVLCLGLVSLSVFACVTLDECKVPEDVLAWPLTQFASVVTCYLTHITTHLLGKLRFMTHRKLTELLGCRGQINRLGSPDCKSRAPHSAPLPFTPHGGSTAYGVGAQPYLLTRLLFPRVHQLNKNVVFRVTVNLVFVGGGCWISVLTSPSCLIRPRKPKCWLYKRYTSYNLQQASP